MAAGQVGLAVRGGGGRPSPGPCLLRVAEGADIPSRGSIATTQRPSESACPGEGLPPPPATPRDPDAVVLAAGGGSEGAGLLVGLVGLAGQAAPRVEIAQQRVQA